jgi:hypothetical protein
MCKLFWVISLHFFITIHSVSATIVNNISQEDIKDHSAVNTLLTVQIDLPETLLDNIRLLSEEIKHAWPYAQHYRETIDFGKVFPALEEGYIIERPIPNFIAAK